VKIPESDVMRALIVEDEPAICELCRRVLSGEGFEVDIAVNGRLAQDLIGKNQYGFCLLDIRMPVMTGKDLYQWLEEKHPQLISRVIFTTGSVLSGDTQLFMEQTGRPRLPKPFTAAELISIVKETLKAIGN